MRKSKLMLLVGATIVAITALSAIVYADSAAAPGSTMGGGMMMGQMMHGMMGRMSRMMGGCGAMMGGNGNDERPNERWRDRSGQS
jgi:hypothetical protein